MHPLSELLCLSSFSVVTIRKPAHIAEMIKQKTKKAGECDEEPESSREYHLP